MTFDELFRISDPKRVTRSLDVNGPPLDIDSYRDAVYYAFNFRSHRTNTTGLRHRGYVKFFRPRNRQQKPLQHLECLVDCTCPDFRYRWAWANKQKGSGAVGARSLNQAWNRAPRRTNPKAVPGLCKHVLAMRGYIYGLLSAFPNNQPDTSEKFDKLLTYATKRWTDFPGAMAAARDRAELVRQRAQLRNQVGPELPAPPEAEIAPEGPRLPRPARPGRPERGAPALPPEVELPPPPEDEEAALRRVVVPYAQRPNRWPTYTSKKPAGLEKTKGKVQTGGFPTVAQYRAARYGESLETARVVTSNGETMKTIDTDIQEAIKLVEEMLDDEQGAPPTPEFGASPEAMPDEELPPMEPPISDSALGADTEGDSALGILNQMRDLLQQLVTALAPPPEEAPEAPTGEGEGEEELAVPEPTEDTEPEAEGEAEEELEEEPVEA